MTEGITGNTGESTPTEIADEIRAQLIERVSYLPPDVSNAIAGIKVNNSVLDIKVITEPGIYRASDENLDGYSRVDVDVANTYVAADEGKVVNNSTLTTQTSLNISENGTYNTTLNNKIIVNVNPGDAIYAIIVVFYPAGITCTASNGVLTFTAKDTSGIALFAVPIPENVPEIWTITATDGIESASATVSVNDFGARYEVLVGQ